MDVRADPGFLHAGLRSLGLRTLALGGQGSLKAQQRPAIGGVADQVGPVNRFRFLGLVRCEEHGAQCVP